MLFLGILHIIKHNIKTKYYISMPNEAYYKIIMLYGVSLNEMIVLSNPS